MNKEIIKSFILAVLVALSAFLTWNIWTYSPNISKIGQKEYIQEVAISNKQEIASIIKPFQFVYHSGNQLYGTKEEDTINRIMKDISSWTFYGFKDISGSISTHDWQGFLQEPGMSELLFSSSIPFSLYKQVINIEDREIPDLDFDRIFIQTSDEEKENQVFFVSESKKRVYKFSVDISHLNKYTTHLEDLMTKMSLYTEIKVRDSKFIYLPSDETKISKYKYKPKTIPLEKFKAALFSDPSSVKQEYTARGDEYTDGSSLMTVINDTM